jgi:hypothetical protein
MRAFSFLIVVGMILLANEARGDEKTIARIECPAETRAKIIWPDKVGKDPTYSRISPVADEWITYSFKEMRQDGQLLSCWYQYTRAGGSVGRSYEYTAKRKIISCKKISPRILDCVVE